MTIHSEPRPVPAVAPTEVALRLLALHEQYMASLGRITESLMLPMLFVEQLDPPEKRP